MYQKEFYSCQVTPSDKLVCYTAKDENELLFGIVADNFHDKKVSVLLTKQDAARLRNQLNEFVGE